MSAVIEHPLLSELETRAGASETDRPAWLAERLTGVTATEVRDLVRLGPSFRRTLLARKLGLVPDVQDLSTVPVIAWGRAREAIIADNLQQRYAIRPESRVFRAADNPRLLASPDGTGVAFDGSLVTSEVKTAYKLLIVGSKEYLTKGYDLQQTWVMRVTGARKSMFACEERIEVAPGVYEPGEIYYEWVPYDEDLAASLEKVALEFLAELDELRAGTGPVQVLDEQLDTDALNYLRGLDLEKEGAALKKTHFEAIRSQLSGKVSFQQVSALTRITYSETPPGREDVPDVDAAKAADPELWESLELLREQWGEHQSKYTKSVPVAGSSSLRVTPVKIKETQS